VLVRTLIVSAADPAAWRPLALLFVYLGLYAAYEAARRRWSATIYLAVQTAIVLALLSLWEFQDYYAILLAALIVQAAPRLSRARTAVWIAVFLLVMALALSRHFSPAGALASAAVYAAVIGLMGHLAVTTERARAARRRNQAMLVELEQTNEQLEAYSARLQGLAAARERTRLARDLHDSVTQTLFSMTLVSRTANLMLGRGGDGLRDQLDRLQELSASALREMRSLVSNLRHDGVTPGGLVVALRQHLSARSHQDGLRVSLAVEGHSDLYPPEEEGLLQIAREALTNVVKHSGRLEAEVRLHLDRPVWMEVVDRGRGFEERSGPSAGHVGIASMRERAEEIGWRLAVDSMPGKGTRVRVERPPRESEA
jgi:signal transduction histidine kinase